MDHRLPHKLRAAPEFDFDEWSQLYRSDPEAFHARRSALIAIELAKGGAYAPGMQSKLEDIERRSEGKSPSERLKIATDEMQASTQELSRRLADLADELRRMARAKPKDDDFGKDANSPFGLGPGPSTH